MLRALTLSYTTAEVERRGHLSLSDDEQGLLLVKLKEVFDIKEALVVSTCNRLECYYSSETQFSSGIIKLICSIKGVDSCYFQDLFMFIETEQDTILHLYRVAMGLESMILGDIQIFGQVKQAYQLSADIDMAGPLLHRVMHSIFHAHKQVCQNTSFKEGTASASYMVIKIIRDQKLGDTQSRILVAGAGEMGSSVCKNLSSLGFKSITIVNRTYDRAKSLAQELDIDQVPMELLYDQLSKTDILISTAASDQPIFDLIEGECRFHCFDLAAPKSMTTAFINSHAITAFNIDEISSCTDETIAKRIEQVEAVEEIIEHSINSINRWLGENRSLYGLREFKASLEEIRKETIAGYLKHLDTGKIQLIEDITRTMMQKIVKIPAMQLKQACMKDQSEELSKTLLLLFNPITEKQEK